MITPIFLLTFGGSFLSLLIALLIIKLKKISQANFGLKLTGFAAGVLLSTAFLDLFPEASEIISPAVVFQSALIGIILFFLLERTFLWFHHHHEAHDIKPTVWMITFGDGLHNFIDGVAIATAYILNPAVGITTALAVAVHEIPQEIADFSILLSRGLTKKQAIIFNVLSAFTAFIGAFLTIFVSSWIKTNLGIVISFTAGMFSYIALSDLIPELHHTQRKGEIFPQIGAFLLGLATVILFTAIFA